MIVPEPYQIFDSPVSLSDKDCERLRSHLSSWNKLNDLLLLGINEPDLQRLVVIELMFKQRRQILEKLLGRLSSLKRKQWQTKVESVIVT